MSKRSLVSFAIYVAALSVFVAIGRVEPDALLIGPAVWLATFFVVRFALDWWTKRKAVR